MKQLSNTDITAVSGGMTAQIALMAVGPILGPILSAGLHPVSTFTIVTPFVAGIAGVAGGYYVGGREAAGYIWGIAAAMGSVLLIN
jgi:hypothetical protein